VQLPFVKGEHASAEFAIAPGSPTRSVTLIVFDCCEYTLNCVAVHPNGTQASTPVVAVVPVSFVLAFGEFTA